MVMKRRRRASGMTLIEVLIALLVTTVALLGALATVGITVHGASFSRNATEASVLAQSKLEQMVSLQQGASTDPLPANATEATIDANGTVSATGAYTRTTTWSPVPGGKQRQVQVEVDWSDAQGKSHSVYATRTQDLK
jgi:Tfp pilus assembly protein PilV